MQSWRVRSAVRPRRPGEDQGPDRAQPPAIQAGRRAAGRRGRP